jgi:MFS family permease
MTPALREIVFINTAHTITHYSLLILPTAVLAMAIPGGPFGSSYGSILALATGMFVLYGLLSLPQGWLAQRFGHKILMTAFFLGTGSAPVSLIPPPCWPPPWRWPEVSPRSTTRSGRRCWWRPQATNPAAPSA